MDISETLVPKSAQLDAIDLRMSGPRVFTVERVSAGNAEQPINVHLAEFDRPWRPGVSMRRVLAFCWGNDASKWVGRKVRLFCDDRVTFGKERPGGTRISHLSHIESAKSVQLLVSQGRSATYKVEPLIESPGAEVAPPGGKPGQAAPDVSSPTSDSAPGVTVTRDDIAACESIPQLRQWWQDIPNDEARAIIDARVKELEAAAMGEQP